MKSAFFIVINLISIILMLYLLFQSIRVYRAMKKCEPVHRKPFVVRKGKQMQPRMYITVLVFYIFMYCVALFFFHISELVLVYASTFLGSTMFVTLFRNAKVGKKGIAIADTFIPWEELDSCQLEWLPLSHSHYPNGILTLTTRSQLRFDIMIEKKDGQVISELLENKAGSFLI